MVQLPRPPYLEPVSPRTTPVQARRLTMYDLPSDSPEDSGLPDEFHDVQPDLLGATCVFPQVLPSQRFIGTDINLYYDERNPRWYKRPDWFVATQVPRLYPGGDLRLSYVVWIEGAPPTMVVELLSPGTEKEDLGPFFGPRDQIDPAIAADTSLQDADEVPEAAKPANLSLSPNPLLQT